MQFAVSFSERIVNRLFTFTFSLYVPSLTQMVSPAVALSIACCIGVLLAMNTLPSRHQPVSFTQISPHVQLSTGVTKTVVSSVSVSITPSSHVTLTILCKTVPFRTDALTITEIFIHLVSLAFSVANFHVSFPCEGAGTAVTKVTFPSYVSVTVTLVAVALPVLFTLML